MSKYKASQICWQDFFLFIGAFLLYAKPLAFMHLHLIYSNPVTWVQQLFPFYSEELRLEEVKHPVQGLSENQ